MKKKRLDRDQSWGFQHFPYYQTRMELDVFRGIVSLIELSDGDPIYWNLPIAGKTPVAGKDMCWLQLLPDDEKRLITVKYLPDDTISLWYVDVIESTEYAQDGVLIYEDKYLDVYFTPQGDIVVDDRDELDKAYSSGELSKNQYLHALQEGERILAELCSDIEKTTLLCNRVLSLMRQKITSGCIDFQKNAYTLK